MLSHLESNTENQNGFRPSSNGLQNTAVSLCSFLCVCVGSGKLKVTNSLDFVCLIRRKLNCKKNSNFLIAWKSHGDDKTPLITT